MLCLTLGMAPKDKIGLKMFFLWEPSTEPLPQLYGAECVGQACEYAETSCCWVHAMHQGRIQAQCLP
jgi:hypothetical protein